LQIVRPLGALLCDLALVEAPPAGAREDSGAVVLRWLGVAGFSISDGGTALLQDPYLSRPGPLRCLFRRYRPDEEILSRFLDPGGPAPEIASARAFLIGHSHFDHLGDAPWLAARTGATVVGSRTTEAISRGYGLAAAQTRRADPGDRFREGPFEIRVVESRHARVLFGAAPLRGEVSKPPKGPIHVLSFKLGDVRDHLITHEPSGLRVYIASSAAVHRPALEALRDEGVEVDALLAATKGRDEGFARTLVEMLRPRLVIPHHYDDFFGAVEAPRAGAPNDPGDLAAFEVEIRDAAARFGLATEVRRLGLFEPVRLTPRD
jgi:L-ascorbate metabolism protein UlaG (beta-lactamase superfamily)